MNRIKALARVDLVELAVPRADGSSITLYLCLDEGAEVAPKPVILLLHGSGGNSVIPRREDGRFYQPIFAAELGRFRQEWNLVVVEKRGVRLGDNEIHLDPQRSREYTQHATRDGRVADVVQVIEALPALGLFDGSRLLLIGHSEGSKVAAGVAARSRSITHLALLGAGDGHGLFDCLLTLRRELAGGAISAAQFEESYQRLVDDFREIAADPCSREKFWYGHTYARWASYAFHPMSDDLLQVKVPIFLGIASEDRSSPPESADLIVAAFVKAGKRNLTVHNYLGYDHGLFRSVEGKAENRQGEVLSDIMQWVAEHRSGAGQEAARNLLALAAGRP
jgi:pimeloyl-ACP methyl ester carboxylesterase